MSGERKNGRVQQQDHEHCLHAAGPLWVQMKAPDGNPAIVGQAETCCFCGPMFVMFIGHWTADDDTHGPFLRLQQATRVAVPQGQILMPGGSG